MSSTRSPHLGSLEALARLASTPPVALGRTPSTGGALATTTAEALARLAMTPPVSLGAACTPTGSLGAPVAKGPRATGAHDFSAPAVFYVNRF